MKRFLAATLAALILLGTAGCAAPGGNEKPLIVCTLFAHYDWARNILGEKAKEFELVLLGNGADLHSYEASAMDLATLGRCDLLIYNGGESEEWVQEAIKQAGVKNTLNISEQVPLLTLPHEHTEEDHHHAYDEHTWLSLKSSVTAVMAVGRGIARLDAANKETYNQNTIAYAKKIQALDQKYAQAIEGGARKTLVFADRYPFRYTAYDYDLTCYAAFDGCAAETEAGAATVANLAKTVDRQNIPVILILENSKEDLAETVIESTAAKNQQILRMDSMQAMTAARMEEETYLSIMEKNLGVLQKALNEGA